MRVAFQNERPLSEAGADATTADHDFDSQN